MPNAYSRNYEIVQKHDVSQSDILRCGQIYDQYGIFEKPHFDLLATDRNKILLMAQVNNETVGFLLGRSGMQQVDHAIVEYLYCDKNWVRSGIGSMMLKKFEDIVYKNSGVLQIMLWPAPGAAPFYEKHGYKFNFTGIMYKNLAR